MTNPTIEVEGLEEVGFVVLGGIFHGGSGPEFGEIDIEPDMGALERIQYELVDSSDDVIVPLCSLPKAQAVIDKLREELAKAHEYGYQYRQERNRAQQELAALKSAPVVVPSVTELIAFAVEEQFLLFCDEDEFVQIAAAVLHKFARPNRSKT